MLDKNGIKYSGAISTYEEYRNILYGNSDNKRDYSCYSLMESGSYQNIIRTIQNVLLNSRLEADYIKQTIITSLNEADSVIDLSRYRSHLSGFEAQLNDIGHRLYVAEGEKVVVIGPSGSGKSVLIRSINGLERPDSGELTVNGIDMMAKKVDTRKLASEVAMVFQDALAALNPTMTVGNQIIENLRHHTKLSKKEAKARAVELLRMVGIPQPESRVDQYPHEFSGGMRQRVMIAIAFACDPKLLIADEPTTALDVTIQAQIIDLIKALQKEKNASVILITHDLGVVANIADRIVVMYAGQIVERGTSIEVFHHPRHPYTNALLEAVPRLDLQNKQQLASIEGTPPDLIAPPKGCPFCTRCKYCMEICCEQQPPVLNFGDGHEASCWLYQLETPAADAPFTQEAHYEG